LTADAAGFVVAISRRRRVGVGLGLAIGEGIFGRGPTHARGDKGIVRLGGAARRCGAGATSALEIAAQFLRSVADVEDAVGNVHPFGFDEQLLSGIGLASFKRGARSQEQAIDAIARSFTPTKARLPDVRRERAG
jgi:hypothetical protein